MTMSVEVWGYIHILLFVFWLGADVGVFVSAIFAKNPKYSFETRMTVLQAGMTVSDLLTKWRMRPELVTVEVNEVILQKLDYDVTEIKAGDKVELVFYMGGGN